MRYFTCRVQSEGCADQLERVDKRGNIVSPEAQIGESGSMRDSITILNVQQQPTPGCNRY